MGLINRLGLVSHSLSWARDIMLDSFLKMEIETNKATTIVILDLLWIGILFILSIPIFTCNRIQV